MSQTAYTPEYIYIYSLNKQFSESIIIKTLIFQSIVYFIYFIEKKCFNYIFNVSNFFFNISKIQIKKYLFEIFNNFYITKNCLISTLIKKKQKYKKKNWEISYVIKTCMALKILIFTHWYHNVYSNNKFNMTLKFLHLILSLELVTIIVELKLLNYIIVVPNCNIL